MWRRALGLATVALLTFAGTAGAKFGMFKTKITLPRVRPAAAPVIAETVSVRIERLTSEALAPDTDLMRTLLEDALAPRYRLVADPAAADAEIEARIERVNVSRDKVHRKETRRVKVRDRHESGDKKGKDDDKEVWENREVPVAYWVVDGSVAGTLVVRDQSGEQAHPLQAAYGNQTEEGSSAPAQAESLDALRQYLVAEIGRQAVALMEDSRDAVEAPLAVDDELKDGNTLMKKGAFADARAEWSQIQLEGKKEGARRHNLGLALEALAYQVPIDSQEHRAQLEKARDLYQQAAQLDQGEKYFRKALERVEAGLAYARAAESRSAQMAALSARRAGARSASAAVRPAEEASSPLMPVDSVGSLANGAFEQGLEPWSTTGSVALVNGGGRGRVLEMTAGDTSASARQAIQVDLVRAQRADLRLDYRVLGGEATLKVVVSFRDNQGRPRVSTMDVSAGEGPGEWSSWSFDLASLRPRPALLTDVRIVAAGATLHLDNCALDVR